MMNYLAVTIMIFVALFNPVVQAATRDNGGAKAIAKLQAMIKDITSERDALRTERDAIKTQSETDTKKLKVELDKLNQEKVAVVASESRLNSELSTQKNNNKEINGRLEKTNARLKEVIEKYNDLNQKKNELSFAHDKLEDVQRQTKTELQTCEGKNIKMYEATKELLKDYENNDVLDTLLKSEPMLQFKTVEMEVIIQEYEDKLRKEKYQHVTEQTNIKPR